MSEIYTLKESCPTDLSPTAIYRWLYMPVHRVGTEERHAGVYPGCGRSVGRWVGYTGTWEGYTGTPELVPR